MAKDTFKTYFNDKTAETAIDLSADFGLVKDTSGTTVDKALYWRLSQVKGSDIASAGTLNFDASAGDLVDVTGTTTVTAITLSEGRKMWVRFTGILTLTHGASLVLPTAASITTAAGDVACFRGYSGGVVRCLAYQRASGAALAGSGGIGGSTGATDNAVLRANGTGGSTAQASGVLIDDSDNIIGVTAIGGKGGGVGNLGFWIGTSSGLVEEEMRIDGATGNVIFSGSRQAVMGSSAIAGPDTGWGRATEGVTKDTDATTGGGTRSSPATSPAQITANQNNYNPGGRSYLQRWNTDASRNITGLVFASTAADGERHIIVNVGSQNIVLQNENASSTAANRFTNSTGADITLSANQAAEIIYDTTSTRWRVFKHN